LWVVSRRAAAFSRNVWRPASLACCRPTAEYSIGVVSIGLNEQGPRHELVMSAHFISPGTRCFERPYFRHLFRVVPQSGFDSWVVIIGAVGWCDSVGQGAVFAVVARDVLIVGIERLLHPGRRVRRVTFAQCAAAEARQ
jgi:hypothetical protein